MIRHIRHEDMAHLQHGWLDTRHHFSFASYYNPDNMNFGKLRVLNDDYVRPKTGFELHPHEDMEIISYVVEGELTHGDSIGNRQTLTRGQVQYMSAGTGIWHSEHNLGDEVLHFLQIWILPDAEGHKPNYGGHAFAFEDRIGKWLPLATSAEAPKNDAPIRLHQDMHAYATLIPAGQSLGFAVGAGRQAYMILIEGEATVNGIAARTKDAFEIVEEDITVEAGTDAHLVLLEMAKG
ncbi:MAG: pirin family protein [Clostridiales Family XIII bacterium]|jgi:redox-sensitive bicupin YhaK (pirin superfamily)|nr:pirin family protein [Clostridiales Family XIII bacterium]